MPLLLCKIIIVLTIVVGVFKKEPSVRSCINVRDAVARLANGGDKYDAEYVPKEREKEREGGRERERERERERKDLMRVMFSSFTA